MAKSVRCIHCNSRRLVDVTTMDDPGRTFLCKDCGELTERVLVREGETVCKE